MGKLLSLLLVVLAVWVLFKGLRKSRPAPEARNGSSEGERMVHCSQCGVYLPESEATTDGTRHFCSEEHRRLFSR